MASTKKKKVETEEPATFVRTMALVRDVEKEIYNIVIISINEKTLECEIEKIIPSQRNLHKSILDFRVAMAKHKILV
jgi:hypothetical protein